MAAGQTTFDKALKIEAVRLVKAGGKFLRQIEDPGVSKGTLSRWCPRDAHRVFAH